MLCVIPSIFEMENPDVKFSHDYICPACWFNYGQRVSILHARLGVHKDHRTNNLLSPTKASMNLCIIHIHRTSFLIW